MATLIETNGQRSERKPASGKKGFTLEELRALIGCEYIEVAHFGHDGQFFVVDEEGKLLDKPINEEATRIYRQAGYDDYIVGNALLCEKGEVK